MKVLSHFHELVLNLYNELIPISKMAAQFWKSQNLTEFVF